jgi:hypothetical protein
MLLPYEIVSEVCGFLDGVFLHVGTLNKQFHEIYKGRDTFISLETCKLVDECIHNNNGRVLMENSQPFDMLAQTNNTKVAEHLLSNSFVWKCGSVNTAIRTRNFEFVQWVIDKKLHWNPMAALSLTAFFGDLDGMKFMYGLGYKPDVAVVGLAAEYGDRETLQWIIDIGCPTDTMVEILSLNGHIEEVKWANSQGLPCNKASLDRAAICGCYDMVTYMLDMGIEADIDTLECACISGSDDILNVLTGTFPHDDFDVIGLLARYNDD